MSSHSQAALAGTPPIKAESKPQNHAYVKKDFTTDLIIERAAAYSDSVTSQDQLKSLVDNAIKTNSWASVAALGWVATNRWPDWIYGYNFRFDGLLKLNCLVDAGLVLDIAVKKFGANTLILLRRLSLSNVLLRWDWTESTFLENIEGSTAELSLRLAFDAALATKSFSTCELILSSPSLPEKARPRLSNELNRSRVEWEALSVDIQNLDLSEKGLEHLSRNGSPRLILGVAWKLYLEGRRDCEFFNLAVPSFPGEVESSLRLQFFRQLAYENHPDNTYFAKRLCCSLVQRGRIEEANEILERHAIFAMDDTEFLMLRLRAIDAANCHPPHNPSIGPGDWDSAELGGFTRLEAIRRANIAKWSGDGKLFGLLSLNLAQRGSGQAVSDALSIPAPMALARPREKIRVAVCISGQLRSFASNWPLIKKTLIDPLNADLFIHTWDKEHHTPPRFHRLNRFIPQKMVDSLPLHFQDAAGFGERFPRTLRKLTKPIVRDVDPKDLSALTSCSKLIIEDDDQCQQLSSLPEALLFNGKSNQAKMFYKTFSCNNLRLSHELELGAQYDVVIRTRSDLHISLPDIQEYVRDAASHRNRIYTSYLTSDGCGDQFAIGSGDAMTAYSAVWPFMKKYSRFDYLPGFANIAAENLLGQHLIAQGIETRLLPVLNQNLVTDLAVVYHDISEELIADAESSGDPAEVANFLKSYHEWRKKNQLHILSA